ncbi:efflux RND transporter periplasmic adaptor subunit [Sansalvadorimonas verongulae]|uniref:efflux RND transporter periplasmic adaptor subunit n=1 Tax=Sansalvadorimonas verongulae TaxID=2172824 RepID=UPI0012BC8235|nr:efflux RND transporter periplasmic adaptor subunit [Sansalvadorimonas verongulae]MTI13955.1 efflux RND transporter periplasmic adaptor subunit [Sansalvadorimonas verongulae]
MIKRKGFRQLTLSSAVLLSCVGLAAGLSNMEKSAEEEEPFDTVLTVTAKTLTPESLSFAIQSQGTVRPSTETGMVTETSGVVTHISPTFVSGGLLKKGDLLATIDDSDYRVSLKQAEAALAASRARLQEEEARSEAEKNNWLNSYKSQGKTLTEAPPLLLRTPQVKEARANVKAATAQLEKAQRDLERTYIRAPYDGMVRERAINLGQFVSKGSRVGSVFSVTNAEVRLPIKPSDLSLINLPRPGHILDTEIVVELTQQQGTQTVTWQAELNRVEGVVGEQSRMHYVIATIPDPYNLDTLTGSPLKMGSFVRAALQTPPIDDLLSLPRGAVYGDGKILLIDENSTLRFQKITPVHADENNIYFRTATKTGTTTRVSLTPLSNPIEGTAVTVTASTDNSTGAIL